MNGLKMRWSRTNGLNKDGEMKRPLCPLASTLASHMPSSKIVRPSSEHAFFPSSSDTGHIVL